ncbi:hypothetical protein SAMN05216404_11464 [Nitrosospira multiformis]|uniref:Uncharacterized protein n=1 Tax=Nitrosospira multiformis TaxID=1231 RepID=A0A1H8MZT8_9PROT|nr:hypothetical protein [Nitrosospira multiformis]SEO22763.1 hypothetical protein SAMN05216404_11464 [Nitrosospira multiformis]
MNNTEEKLKWEASIELRIKHLKLWGATVAFVASLIPTVATVFSHNEVKGLLSHIAQKPLEGEWDYSSNYEKYHKEPNPQDLYGGGRALIIWKYQQSRYDVNLSYSIKRRDDPNPILTAVLQGTLKADENGWPAEEGFVMDNFKLLEQHHRKYRAHNMPAYEFTNCNLKKSLDRANSISCILETPDSKSEVEFTWRSSLH